MLLACALVAPGAARADSAGAVPAGARRSHLAQAAAAAGADPATDPQIAQWMATAQGYWGAAPNCPQGISIQRAQWLPDPGVWAAAVQGGCAMAFDPDFYPAPAGYDQGWYQAAMCSVVAHEWGHLLGYGHVADRMVELAAQQPGFLGIETVRGPDGFGITVSYWSSLEAISAWKQETEHQSAQEAGKNLWYSEYQLRISHVQRAYGKTSNA